MAAAGAAAFTRNRLRRRKAESLTPDGSVFTVYAAGGRYGFVSNGRLGWVIARTIPVTVAGAHDAVAAMLDVQFDDELLDIGCGPGASLATKAWDARRAASAHVIAPRTSSSVIHR